MATKILPHNLVELLQAQVAYLQDQPFAIRPDFPTGGLADLSEYNDGNGKVLVRAQLDASDPKRILIREIPFGTTTEQLIASIEDAARKNKIKIGAISDYTAEEVEIEIKLPRGTYTEEIVDALYAFTDCELSISTHLMLINQQDKPQAMSATEVLQHNVDRLVDILKAELHLEADQLNDRLHARTLEQIFIANRVYEAIEGEDSPKQVAAAVRTGLAPFAAQIKRAVTADDIDALLAIPIRRISLYDTNRAQKEMAQIRGRLREIKGHLDGIIPYAISFLQDLISRYRSQFPRRTKIVELKRVDARSAANRNLKLRYDKKTGYLGHQINGAALFDVSLYDKVLAIRKDGSYSVVHAPDKLFVGTGLLHCGLVDKDLIFSIVYKDKAGASYIKRCTIDKFILGRSYELVPAECKVLKLTTDSDKKIALNYKPKPRLRKLDEVFSIGQYPVRGHRAGGIRLTTKELAGCKLV